MTTKICSTCRENPADPKVRRRNQCRPCYRAYMAQYMATRRASQGRDPTPPPGARLNTKKALAALVGGGRCADCGWVPASDREWCALEFHHRDPTTKRFAISRARGYGVAALEQEAKKCDLLCARCHRLRHG